MLKRFLVFLLSILKRFLVFLLSILKKFLVAIWNFISPMWRTIWIALAGQGLFLVSVITMSPLRMWENPVVNYNLFYMPILAVVFGWLLYRCCTEAKEARACLMGFFAAVFAWPLIGEVANIPVDKGVITQVSDFNIKTLGAYFYVLACWAILHIMWRTGALKKSVCVFFMTFLSIWSFELYMDNYSSMEAGKFLIVAGLLVAAIAVMLIICLKLALGLFRHKKPVWAILGILVTCILAALSMPAFMTVLAFDDTLRQMPATASLVLYGSLIATFLILRASRRTDSLERKTILGCIFYIVFALFLMSFQWKEPQTFYVKYEASHIDHEIEALKQDKKTLARLFDYMSNKRKYKDGKSTWMLKAGDYKYMLEHDIITKDQLMGLVNTGRIDGKGLEFLTTRSIITIDEFQDVLNNRLLTDADMQPLVDMGIARKNDEGIYELQRQYIKIKDKEK